MLACVRPPMPPMPLPMPPLTAWDEMGAPHYYTTTLLHSYTTTLRNYYHDRLRAAHPAHALAHAALRRVR